MTKLKSAYELHKRSACARNIEFLLTYKQWLTIWKESGKLSQRGRGRNQYCMARYKDKGPYAVGNVRIITVLENARERDYHPSKKQREDHSKRMSGAGNPMFGKTHTSSVKAKLRAQKTGKHLSAKHKLAISVAGRGKRRNTETKAKMSLAQRNRPNEVNMKISHFASARLRGPDGRWL